jgi:hypothetical protein
MSYKKSYDKDDDVFNLNHKTHYNIEAVGYLKPFDSPAASLRANEYVPNDSNKPAVNLKGVIVEDLRQIPEIYMKKVQAKINYVHISF